MHGNMSIYALYIAKIRWKILAQFPCVLNSTLQPVILKCKVVCTFDLASDTKCIFCQRWVLYLCWTNNILKQRLLRSLSNNPVWRAESLQDSALQDCNEEEIVLSDLKLEKQDSDGQCRWRWLPCEDGWSQVQWRGWRFSLLSFKHWLCMIMLKTL